MEKQQFEEVKSRISCDYSVQQYQRLSGDRRLESVPRTLKVLWRSDDSRVIDAGTMDGFYSLYRSGLISEAEFTAMLTDLEAAFAHEFEPLNKSKYGRKEGSEMKGLLQFQSFAWPEFSEGKVFISIGVSEYLDFATKQHLGTKVEAVIAEDRTPYQFKDGQSFTNRYEKVTFKVAKDVNIPVNTQIIPKGVTATIYGDYRNQLSIKCEDIEVVAAAKEKN